MYMKGTFNLYCNPKAHSGNAPSNINKLNLVFSKSLVSGSSRSASQAWNERRKFIWMLEREKLLLWAIWNSFFISTNLDWIANDIEHGDRHEVSHSSTLGLVGEDEKIMNAMNDWTKKRRLVAHSPKRSQFVKFWMYCTKLVGVISTSPSTWKSAGKPLRNVMLCPLTEVKQKRTIECSSMDNSLLMMWTETSRIKC